MKDMAHPATGRPLKRFTRPETPSGLSVTARDIAMLRSLLQFRFLTSRQIALLDGGSPQNVQRCLKALWENKLVDRPRAQLVRHIADGDTHLVYALGRRGARLLAELDGSDIGRLNWTAKNTEAGTVFISHAIGVADVIIPLVVGCRAEGAPRLIDQPELTAALPPSAARSRNPFLWKATALIGHRREELAQVPDRVLAVETKDGARRSFALELDTGSMPVNAFSLKRSSIRRKLISYLEGWHAKEHERLHLPRLRVLFVTSSQARVDSMRKLLLDITHGKASGLFLFTTLDAVKAGHPFDAIWHTADNHMVPLL